MPMDFGGGPRMEQLFPRAMVGHGDGLGGAAQDGAVSMAALFEEAVRTGASDLLVTAHTPPLLRIDGDLQPVGTRPLMPDDTRHLIAGLLNETQREAFADTHSFGNALKYVLRQDPDVIFVGEMRDLETIAAALTAAETGHLVIATLHTNDAIQAIDRMVDVFPPQQQIQIRTQLAFTLLGVIAQQLIPRADGA